MRLDERVEGKLTSVEKKKKERVCPQLTQLIGGLQHTLDLTTSSSFVLNSVINTQQSVVKTILELH